MPVNILQITDTHIHDMDVSDFYGTQPLQTLNQAIRHALANTPKIDYVVVTGDLSHEGGETSAEYLKNCLQQFDCPVYVTPGNHDDANIIERYLLCDQITMPVEVQLEHWQLLFADSHIDAEVHGHINDYTLKQLNQQLGNNSKPALMFTHHPPTNVGCEWLDNIAINNGTELLNQMAIYPQLKAIVFGHIHQQFEHQWEHFLLLGCPSTCIQFKPNSKQFATDNQLPGYRILSLNSQAKLTTHVVRCPE